MKLSHLALKYKIILAIALFCLGLMIRLLVIPYQVSEKIHVPVLPRGSITLTPAQSSFRAGEIVSVTLINEYPTTIHLHDNCPLHPMHIYRYVSAEWQPVISQPQSAACDNANADISLEPHAQKNMSYANWPDLFREPGTYRIVATLDQYHSMAYCELRILPRSYIKS